MPYLAISSAALAVRACASAGVAPSASALAGSFRMRGSSVSVGLVPAACAPAAWEFTKSPPAQGVWIEYVIERYPEGPTFPHRGCVGTLSRAAGAGLGIGSSSPRR